MGAESKYIEVVFNIFLAMLGVVLIVGGLLVIGQPYRVWRRRRHRDIKPVLLGIGAGIVAGAIVSALVILLLEWVRRSYY